MGVKRLSEAPVLATLNTTELWQMARRLGVVGAGPSVPRSLLLKAIEDLEDISVPDPTMRARLRFSSFLKSNWDRLQMQMQKEHCPDCHLSSDMEFADCWLDNHHLVS